jgi:hypothetical protein
MQYRIFFLILLNGFCCIDIPPFDVFDVFRDGTSFKKTATVSFILFKLHIVHDFFNEFISVRWGKIIHKNKH